MPINNLDFITSIENSNHSGLIDDVYLQASNILQGNILPNLPTHLILPVAIVLAMHHVSVASITLLLHRDMTHKSLTVNPKLAIIKEGFIRMTSSIVAKEWVAAHTQHHKEADNKPDLEAGFLGDPHTPQELPLGKWEKTKELIKQYFDFGFGEYFQIIDKLYENGSIKGEKPNRLKRFGPSLAMFGSYIAMFGPMTGGVMSLSQAALGRLTITLVNGVGHSADERSNRMGNGKGDYAMNITSDGKTFWGRRWNNFLSFQTVGEEHHGNHHENMKSADITLGKPGQFDLGYKYAKLLEAVGLVWDIKVPKSGKKEEVNV